MTQPRSVGVEHVGLHALSELGLIDTLQDLGSVMQASIIGSLIGRMGQPGSELATGNWLQQQSTLGELLDVDFLSMSHLRLYRASDEKELSPDGQELCLYCHSPSRQLKEEAMLEQSCRRFEAGLQQMLDGLKKPCSEKRHDKLTVMTSPNTPDHESHDRFPPLQGAFRFARRNRSLGAEHAPRIPHLTPRPSPASGRGEIRQSLTRLSH